MLKLKSLLIFLILFFALISPSWATTKYFIPGGGGFWSLASSWSTTSGGSADTTVPTSADDVILDENSGEICRVNTNADCKSITMTNFTGNLTGSSVYFSVYGNFLCGSSQTVNFNGTLIIKGTSNVNLNGKTLGGPFEMDNANSNVTLTGNFNSTSTVLLGRGIFNSNGYSLTCTSFGRASNANSLTITLGSSTINCSSFDFGTYPTNLTFNYDTSTIIVNQSATGTMNFSHGSCEFYNLTLNGYTNKVSVKSFAGNLTVHNQLSLQGNSAVNRLWIKSNTTGTQRTLTAASVDLDNVDFQDITFAGAATWSGTSIGNCGGNSGTITYTTPVTRYWVDTDGGSWSATTSWDEHSGGGGGDSVPLCHDTIVFNENSITSGSRTITVDMPRIGDINTSNITSSPDFALLPSQTTYFFKNFIVGNHTFSGLNAFISLESRDNVDINVTTASFDRRVYLNTYGAAAILKNNFTSSAYFHTTTGTLDLNDYNFTVNQFNNSLSSATVYLGNGIITITGYGSNVCNCNSGLLTVYPENSTIILTNTTANTKTFSGYRKTFYKLKFSGSSGACIITGNNTFNTLEVDSSGGANTLTLTSGTTQTVTNFKTNGVPGKLITLNSSTPGSPATLTGTAVNQYLRGVSFQDITFAGSVWYYDKLSTKGAGNSGRIFPWIVSNLERWISPCLN